MRNTSPPSSTHFSLGRFITFRQLFTMVSPENNNWLYGLLDEISVPDPNFSVEASAFNWSNINASSNIRLPPFFFQKLKILYFVITRQFSMLKLKVKFVLCFFHVLYWNFTVYLTDSFFIICFYL